MQEWSCFSYKCYLLPTVLYETVLKNAEMCNENYPVNKVR